MVYFFLIPKIRFGSLFGFTLRMREIEREREREREHTLNVSSNFCTVIFSSKSSFSCRLSTASKYNVHSSSSSSDNFSSNFCDRFKSLISWMCAFPVVDLVSANSLNLKKYYYKPELQLYFQKKIKSKPHFLTRLWIKKISQTLVITKRL